MNIQDPSLDRYRQLIDGLKQPKQSIDSQQALEILTARDALQVSLDEQKPIPIDLLQQVIELDTRFRDNAIRLTAAINKNSGGELERWRESVKPSAEAWWWRLESIESPAPKQRLDWLWKTLRLGTWAANISLLVNIVTRFGGAGGVGFFDPLVVIVPGIGALLSAGDKIPTFEGVLKRLNIPKPYLETTKFSVTMTIFLLLMGGSRGIPLLSEWANRTGVEKFNAGDIGNAEKEYKRSISLNGNNIDAHYNLGNLYEALLDNENAKKQYQIAIADKLPQAYNNLGRLYIKEKKYPEAVVRLVAGVNQTKNEDTATKDKTLKIQYSLYKNLGWARLEQKRYQEAKEALVQAIDILGKQPKEESSLNPGAAHCLLAQTLEQLKQPATQELQQCSSTPVPLKQFDGDEDSWRYLATQKLAKIKTTKSK
jgi:tetratricopeptide (TPR) repeat protein